ncbi:type II/IV secretion system family protein [Acinetobacter baumannii 1406589]|nr:type II/IV secretion system family protein [Acinetobacter baumannii 1406589]
MYDNYIQYSVLHSGEKNISYGHSFSDFANSNDVNLIITDCEQEKGTLQIKFNDRDSFYFELSVVQDNTLEFFDAESIANKLKSLLLDDLILFGIQDILDHEFGVTDIAINKPSEFWFKKGDKWIKVENENITFDSLMNFAKNFAEYNNTSINFDNPLCNGQMPFGYNCQIVIPPAVENGVVAIVIVIK